MRESVDLDLLAEYAAGLLDPVHAAEVEGLVETEPAWAGTLAALVDASPRVQAALASLGEVSVPADVVDRLDAAIPPPATDRSVAESADDTTATVVDIDTRRAARFARRATDSRRSRRSRIAMAATGVAAAIAVIVGGLVLRHNPLASPSADSAMSGGKAAAAPEAAASGSASGGLTILATGTDYTPQTLRSVGGRVGSPGAGPYSSTRQLANGDAVSEPLRRLETAADRQTCLNEVTATHGGVPTMLDYARYQGRPALVVVLSTPGAGAGEVVVVGPDCGLPGSGTDQIYAVPLR